MTFQINFKIDGPPRAKGRPRFANRGKFVSTYTDSKTRAYEDHVRECAKKAMGSSLPLETALDAFIYVCFGVPASYSKKRKEACLNGSEKHIKKPDLDNVVKAVLDGCEKVIFWSDAQIVYTHSTKKYGHPHVEVLFRESE